MKPEVVVEREVRPPPAIVASPSPPPRRRAPSTRHDDDDDEWVDNSPRKRSRNRPISPTPVALPTTRVQTRVIPAPIAPATSAPVAAPAASVPVTLPPNVPVTSPAEERRRAASNHSRLQMLLFKHKEMLKKDIIKKRGLLEKELGVEIQVSRFFVQLFYLFLYRYIAIN